jgi:hypothetical protein
MHLASLPPVAKGIGLRLPTVGTDLSSVVRKTLKVPDVASMAKRLDLCLHQ